MLRSPIAQGPPNASAGSTATTRRSPARLANSPIEIATAVEDKFGVAIPDDELGNIKTVGDAISFIEKNQG